MGIEGPKEPIDLSRQIPLDLPVAPDSSKIVRITAKLIPPQKTPIADPSTYSQDPF